MSRHSTRSLALSLMRGAVPAIAVLALAAGTMAPRSQARTISSGGHRRTYRVYVPATLPKDVPSPLVLVFHGGDRDGASVESLTRFDDLADQEKFLVVYPDGVDKHWNDGRGVESFVAVRERVDDVAFVSDLLDATAREFRVDSDRVYATGYSNGGIFSNFLGARLASRLAAVASVAGGLAEPLRSELHPARPISVLLVFGKEDPIIPYAGGAVATGHGQVVGAEETARLWAAANGCASHPEKDAPSAVVGECRTVRTRWTGGRGRSAVVLDTIEGGGHTWPGGATYAPAAVVGRTCPEPDATREIWDFFRAHPRVAAASPATHS